MDYKKLLPSFSESEIKSAKNILYKYSDNKACSNNRIFKKAIKATYSDDFTNMSLKRTFLKECNIRKSNFTGAAVTGSRFIQTLFEDCTILGASFQCCDFIESKLKDFSVKIEASNFSNSAFIDTEFKNINFLMNTIFQSLFENCIFTDCKIETTTLEGSVFRDCIFTNVDLSNLNIDYVTLHNPVMHNVKLPFFQLPYIINGFSFLTAGNNEIWIDSEKSSNGKIKIEEYLHHTNELIIYFYGLKEFFPLANIYLAKNEPNTALACIMEGIERASKNNDFRMIKHFCRLVTSTPLFKTEDMKKVYNLIESRFEPGALIPRDLHNYLLNIGEIRATLFNGNYNLQTLEIIIQTNIDSNEAERTGVFLNSLNKLFDEYNVNSRSQFVELRHNSDYTIFISCVNEIKELMPLLVSLYAAFGVVDKVAKFYDTILNIGTKRNDIRKRKNISQTSEKAIKSQDESDKIKMLEKQIRELKSDKRKITEENKMLTSSVLELTHYIKGMTNHSTDTDLLYSRTVFENQENRKKNDNQKEN